MSRRAVLTLFPDRAPELGLPEKDAANTDAGDTGTLMAGFVERVGKSTNLKPGDHASHDPGLLLVEALDALITATGGEASTSNITIAVPGHWGPGALRVLQDALTTHAGFVHSGMSPRLVQDSVAALTALNSDSRLPAEGVVALLDFGGSGTSITLADAASDFTPIADTVRYPEFSGDSLDQALMVHVLDNVGHGNGTDPASTGVAAHFAGLREECRLAKERLSKETATEFVIDLQGQRSRVEVSRAEFDRLVEDRLGGLLSALDQLLSSNSIRSKDLAAVALAGGGARIPLVAQGLSSHTKSSVVTAVQPGFAMAVGAVMLAAKHPVEEQEDAVEVPTMATLVGASTGSVTVSTGTFAVPTDALGASTGTFDASTGTFTAPADAFFSAAPSAATPKLAWSEADDTGNEPIYYTGEPYDDDDRSTPSQLMQLPRYEPLDARHRGNRLPQLFLGVAALVSMVAIGGVAYTLTSSPGTNRAPTLPSTTTAVPAPPLSSQLPSPSPLPPPPSVAPSPTEAPPPPVSEAPPPPTSEAPPPPPPPPPVTTYHPPPTHRAPVTTTTQLPTTTAPPSSTTPSTTPPPPPPPTTTSPTVAMTTTYLNLPFVPVPIPVQVPEGQGGAQQQPQNPYQQNPYQQSPYQQNPYQQSPYMPQNPYASPGYGY